MNIVDIVLIVLIVLGGLQGLQRGLITGLANLFGTIAGFIIAASQYLRFLTWVEGHLPIRQWLEPKIYKLVLPSVMDKVGAIENQTLDKLNEFLNNFPAVLRDNLSSGVSPDLGVWTEKASEQFALNISGTITEYVLRIAAFLFLYFVVVALIQLIVSIALKPVGGRQGALNRFGGAIFGSLSSFIYFSILVGLLTPFLNTIAPDLPLTGWIQNATLYPYLISMFEFLSGLFWSAIGSEILEPLRVQREMWF